MPDAVGVMLEPFPVTAISAPLPIVLNQEKLSPEALLVVAAVKVTGLPKQIVPADAVTAVMPVTFRVATEEVTETQGEEPEITARYR